MRVRAVAYAISQHHANRRVDQVQVPHRIVNEGGKYSDSPYACLPRSLSLFLPLSLSLSPSRTVVCFSKLSACAYSVKPSRECVPPQQRIRRGQTHVSQCELYLSSFFSHFLYITLSLSLQLLSYLLYILHMYECQDLASDSLLPEINPHFKWDATESPTDSGRDKLHNLRRKSTREPSNTAEERREEKRAFTMHVRDLEFARTTIRAFCVTTSLMATLHNKDIYVPKETFPLRKIKT